MFYSIRKAFSLTSKRDKQKFMFIAIVAVSLSLLEIIAIGCFYPIINISISNSGSIELPEKLLMVYHFFNVYNTKDIFNYTIVTLICLYLFKNSLSMVFNWYHIKFGYSLERKISTRLFRNYLNTPYSKFVLKNTPELIRNVTGSISNIRLNVIEAMLSIINNGLILILFMLFFMYINISIFLFICLMLIVAFIIFRYSTKDISSKYGKIYHDSEKSKNVSIIEALKGFKETTIFQKGDEFLSFFDQSVKRSNTANTILQTITRSTRLYIELFVVISVLLLMYIIFNNSENYKDLIVNLSLFTLSIFRILPATLELFNTYPRIRHGKISVDVIYDELQYNYEKNFSKISKNELLPFKKKIELKNICFKYNSRDKYVLENISLKINKNEMVGIVGSSGSGKTTLVDIIIGLLSPDSGQVLIDGKDIYKSEYRWWPQIGYIPQNIYLTNNTIKNNIAFGLKKDNIDDKKIVKSLKLASLNHLINELKEKENTLIGENGIQLSGGQRQRLGIARALYNDPMVLIFDEATASLDTVTENEIINSIHKFIKNKTTIIIAHRLSTIQKCDKIFVIDKGILEAEGTFKELKTKSSVFKKIVNAAKNKENI